MRLRSVLRFAWLVVLAGSVLLPIASVASAAPNGLRARVWVAPVRVPAIDPLHTTPPITYGDINCTFVGAMLNGSSASDARARCDAVVPAVQDARRVIAGLAGADITRGIELVLLVDPIHRDVPAQSTAVSPGTVGCYEPGSFAGGDPDCGGLPPEGALRDAPWRCQVQIGGDFASGYNGQVRRSALAHELFHCLQRERTSQSVATFFRTTPWLNEGSAAWIGEVYANGSSISSGWWLQAVTAPGASTSSDACPDGDGSGPAVGCVYGRSRGYSAHAFFFALAETQSAATVARNVLAAVSAGGGNEAAMAILAPGNHPVWLHWAGFGRAWAAGGSSWVMRAPGNGAPARTQWRRSLTLQTGPQVRVAVAPTENKIADITWNEIRTGEQNMVVDLNGTAIARWVNGSGDPVGPEITTNGSPSRTTVCITSRCTSGAERPPQGAQKIVVAVSGTGATSSSATVSVECPAPTTSGSSRISALQSGGVSKCCLVGEWQMSQPPIYGNFNSISGGAGAILTIEPDGHLVVDYGPMSEWVVEQTGRADLGRVHLKLDGQLVADIDLDKLVNQRRVKSLATEAGGVLVTASVEIPGSPERLDFGTQPFSEWFALIVSVTGEPPEESAVDLTCNASTLRLTDSVSGITHEFTRLSEPVCGGSSCDARRGEA